MGEEVLRGGGKASAALGALCCLGADAGAFFRRFGAWTRWYIKQLVKALLPEFVLARVRQARQKTSLGKGQAEVASSWRG